jgi:phage-related protein
VGHPHESVLDLIYHIWHILEVLKGAMKPLIFVADSRRALAEFPKAVQQQVGFALYQAQMGGKHIEAKPLKNVGAGVLEVVSDHRGDTFRTVYTVKLEKAVYVLHAFQKKSKKGIATPKQDVDLIKQRYKEAQELAEDEQE